MLHHHSRLNNNLAIVTVGAIVAALSIISCTSVPTPSAKATPTPAPLIALAGTPVPVPAEAISPENAGRVVQLARWGKGTINQVAWSPDGKQLVVVSAIGIYFYDVQTWQQTRFVETRSQVESVAFSPAPPDGSTGSQVLAYGGEGGMVKLWDVAGGCELRTLSGFVEWTIGVMSLAFSPDGELLAMREWERGALSFVQSTQPRSQPGWGFDGVEKPLNTILRSLGLALHKQGVLTQPQA